MRLDRDAATQDVLDYLLAAPVVPVEGSWPRMASLAELVLLVGGLGAASLGVVTGQGDLVEYGAVLTTTGAVVVEVRGRGRADDGTGNATDAGTAPRPTGAAPAATGEPAPAPAPAATLADLLDGVDAAAIQKLGLDKRRSDDLRFTAAKRLIETGTFGPSPATSAAASGG